MIYRKQLYRHEPHNEIYGDCQRTVIACLLDREPHTVPHFVQNLYTTPGYDWQDAMEAFLNENGLSYTEIQLNGSATLADVLSTRIFYPDHFYILAGKSPRGVDHVVIGCGDEIVWDTHPDGGGLVGPCSHGVWEMGFIQPLSMKRIPTNGSPGG